MDEGVQPIPPFLVSNNKNIADWLTQHQPDVIICTDPDSFSQILPSLNLPVAPALIVLNHESKHRLPGVRQPDQEVGAAAVDLVVDQIHRNERGIPSTPKCTLMPYEWIR